MNYNFKILNSTYRTINYINKLLVNYPKKEVILKNNIERTCYETVEFILLIILIIPIELGIRI